jgi:hypothetical protein
MNSPTKKPLTRRQFLALGGLALGGLALNPFNPFPPYTEEQDYGRLARVAIHEVDLRAAPRDGAEIIGKRYRDQLVHLYADVIPADAPAFYNKLWYKVWAGYLHSSYLQLVKIRFNPVVEILRAGAQLAEVTVPFTQSYSFNRYHSWRKEYRLYYETTHWVTGLDSGPDGRPWYRLTDELQPVDYFVPAEHLRLIPDEELTPLSPEVHPQDKRIEVELARQTLRAYEKDQLVLETKISSGIPSIVPPTNGIPSVTPKGNFRIYSKMASKHMGDGRLMRGDLNLDAYELVGVPWTMFFHRLDTGYALHGTYWHNNFGWQMSHGCVNMRNAEARWLFRWTTPAAAPGEVEKTGYGTAVRVY